MSKQVGRIQKTEYLRSRLLDTTFSSKIYASTFRKLALAALKPVSEQKIEDKLIIDWFWESWEEIEEYE